MTGLLFVNPLYPVRPCIVSGLADTQGDGIWREIYDVAIVCSSDG